ncbi:MAG: bifunctional adenosylcobinamide kinase/adenosylcobinamide-phosphate guanylyltransferase [Thermobacillus sp.]|uniref:bifunctional adenosylcobinamide kinase/adenosylcobinamide-phosphate guanylyltransferase n=1 Tax=Thermobacillus sp. TaxID=2108467 RepID=UPI000E3B2725|nr:bifunctional adenosylcobinamide kinase/adenosylcobinamide-phosphate guanylyltransferase [Thermobacillus sp.]REK54499.1 MAG: bifunctional adenosylcobinamide kinase/adenosylcobinamide-phosphate guanylyltransferase [Thermobacillus sp.]
MAVLVTGGARSGKSRFAESYAARLASRGIYVATAQPLDDEMERRVRAHREERRLSGFAWETVEEPLDLVGLLDRLAAPGAQAGRPVVLVDCLTLWLSNHLLAVCPDGGADRARVEREMDGRIEALAGAVRRFPLPLVLVTNEVGAGIVPETALGRMFRDAAGRMNQRLAGVCDRLFLVVSGIPVDLKSIEFRMDEL